VCEYGHPRDFGKSRVEIATRENLVRPGEKIATRESLVKPVKILVKPGRKMPPESVWLRPGEKIATREGLVTARCEELPSTKLC
jgi:hypothetical protein